MVVRLSFRLFLALLILFTHCSFADDSTPYLFQFDGKRAALEEQGLTFTAVATHDVIGPISGGVRQRAAVVGALDLMMNADLEKLMGVTGTKFFIYGAATYGNEVTKLVGDIQYTDANENVDGAYLIEAYLEKSLFDSTVTVSVGLRDFTTDFYVISAASSLMNWSFQNGGEYSQIGANLWPMTAFGSIVKYTPREHFYVQTALYDGLPGDSDHNRGTYIRLAKGEGILFGTEAGILDPDTTTKVGAGLWYRTTKFEDFSGTLRDRNNGFYLIAERQFYKENEDGSQGLSAFLQYGHAPSDRNQYGHSYGAGVAYTGLFSERDEDITSFGIVHLGHGKEFKYTDESLAKGETAFELTYHAQLLPYLSLQPDLQYVIDPGAVKNSNNATVVGLRLSVSF